MNVRRILIAVAALLCAACSSTPERAPARQLPYHLAVIPLEEGHVYVTEATSQRGGSTKMRIEVNPENLERLSRSLADELDGRTFARVTLLEPAGRVARPGLTPEERDGLWLEQAVAAGADLLLELELDLDPDLREERNEGYYYNLPLFLVGGPFCWWVNDRSYYADVRLRGRFYDVGNLEVVAARTAAFRTSKEHIADASHGFDQVSLDFVDRAQGDVGKYALSVVWPSGELAEEGPELQEDLVVEIIGTLCRGFADGVQTRRADLERGHALFFLETDLCSARREADGAIVLRGVASLEPTSGIESLRSLRIEAGGMPRKEISFADWPAIEQAGSRLRYTFEERLEAPEGVSTLDVDLVAGTRSARVRTYTFGVRAAPEATRE